MNQYDRLKENRRDYNNKFLLGFFGGKGLLSALILAVLGFLKLRPKNAEKNKSKDGKGPEQFDIIK